MVGLENENQKKTYGPQMQGIPRALLDNQPDIEISRNYWSSPFLAAQSFCR